MILETVVPSVGGGSSSFINSSRWERTELSTHLQIPLIKANNKMGQEPRILPHILFLSFKTIHILISIPAYKERMKRDWRTFIRKQKLKSSFIIKTIQVQ